MSDYIRKSVALYWDKKNSLYWLFPRNTIERGLYILGLPAKRFDVASTDFATLVNEAMDLMQHCRKVTYDEAMQQLKDRFRKETKWYSSLALQKSSSAILGIYCENNEFRIDVFSAKKEELGDYKCTIKRSLASSQDELVEVLIEAFEFYK